MIGQALTLARLQAFIDDNIPAHMTRADVARELFAAECWGEPIPPVVPQYAPYSQCRMLQADEMQQLRDEAKEALAENARLRRTIERMQQGKR